MSCNCNKPKCDGKCGISPSVLQINNPGDCTLFHRVEIPASMGDSITNPPKNGDYRNVLLYYVADGTSWLFSSDGIPQKLVSGFTDYEDAINLPQINGVTLLRNKTNEDLGLQGALTADGNTGLKLENDVISGLPATDTNIGMVKPGENLNVDSNGVLEIIGDISSIQDTHNPIHYGADPSGEADSIDAINACIQANKGGVVNFTPGTYYVSSSINLPFENSDKVSINGNGAVIKTDATMDSLIIAGADRPAGYTANNVGFPSYIDKLTLDGSAGNVTNGILNMKGYKDLKIFDCTIFRFVNGVKIGDTAGGPTDILISNCLIYGKGSEYDGVGVISNGTDNNVDMCRIYGFRKGFEINGFCNITKCHVLLRWAEQTGTNFDPYTPNTPEFDGYYEQTMFADVSNTCRIVMSYCDSMYKFLEINTTGLITVDSSFYYNSRTVDEHLFEFNTKTPNITISNCLLNLKKNDDCQVIVTRSGLFTNGSQINITNNLISGFDKMTNSFDIILSSVGEETHTAVSLDADTWYIVKAFPNFASGTIVSGVLYINGYPYNLRLDASSITQFGGTETDSDYTAGVFVENNTLFLCIKRGISAVGTKFDFFTEHTFYKGWSINPVHNDRPSSSSRELSVYTASTPTTTRILKNS